MPRMTEREIVALVDNEFASAMGAPEGQISEERAKAWDYYQSKLLGNEVEGQSKVVTSDVSDVVDSIIPPLLRMFTTEDNLVSFDPVGAEDVEQADQESDYVSHVFFKQNPAFMLLYCWIFDGLTQKNGFVKCWVDESERVTTEHYSNLTDNQLYALLADDELEPIERSEAIDNETGQILHEIEFKRVTKHKRIRVENVPPDEYRISADARSIYPDDARMVGQEREITRSDLLAMGFDEDIVDKLPAHNGRNLSSEQIARYSTTDEEQEGITDRSQDLILVREAYIWLDYEGKGRSELRQIFTSNGHLLSNECADRQPFHVWSPKPLPHKHFGRCPAEDVMDIQEVTTTLTRQTLDNLYHSNNPGHAVNESAFSDNTLDDLLTRRVGGVVRFNRPIGEAWQPMSVPFTAGASFDMLSWFDKTKRDRTGVHSDAEGLQPDALKHIQQSVMGQSMDMSRMKIEAIARIFAETGLKSLFLHIHELVRKHIDRKEIVRLRNKFVEVDPAGWRDRSDMTVNIGLGIASKESAMMMLTQVIGLQEKVVANGGMNILVSPQNIYNAAAELVKASGLKSADLYFTNPQNASAPSMTPEEMQLQQQQQQIAQRQQQLDAQQQQFKYDQMQLKHQEEMMKLREQMESREDKLFVEIEKLKAQYAEMGHQTPTLKAS